MRPPQIPETPVPVLTEDQLRQLLKACDGCDFAVRRDTVFYADADPVHRVITYVPWTIAEGTGLLEPEVGHPYGIHGIFEDHGHVMTRIREEILARMPGPEGARWQGWPGYFGMGRRNMRLP